MRFALTPDQVAFRDAARELLAKECAPSVVRAAWDAPAGQLDRGVWDSLDAMGVLALLVPESDGGLGLDETYLVPILEECGRAALPHPVVETAMVAAPLLGAGAGMVATDLGGPLIPCAADSDVLLLRAGGGALVAVPPASVSLTPVAVTDRARRTATATADATATATRTNTEPATDSRRSDDEMSQVRSVTAATRTNTEPATDSRRSDDDVSQVRSVAGTNSEPATDSRRSDDEMSQVRSVPFTRTNSEPATDSRRSDDKMSQVRSVAGSAALVTDDAGAIEQALDRGALGTAALLVGLGQAMLDLTVGYVTERHQFGKPVGSFQAVKHHLADAALALELARPAVHRAAWSLAHGAATSARDVSMAKAMASDAAELAGRKALQCHGAIGYTVEADLHLYLKRTWALARSWGDSAHHTHRVATAIGAHSVQSC